MATQIERSIVETLNDIWSAIEWFRADLEQKAMFLKIGDWTIKQEAITRVVNTPGPAGDLPGLVIFLEGSEENSRSYITLYGIYAAALRWYLKQISLDVMSAYGEAHGDPSLTPTQDETEEKP